MNISRHFNPDHYLQTPKGRIYTEERNAAAWHQLYLDLEYALSELDDDGVLYIVCGIPGAGKSTWIKGNISDLGDHVLFLDAALPKTEHRARALELAKVYGVKAIGIMISTPLDIAISRNLLRSQDEQVPEAAIRAVNSMFEKPTFAEGFDEIVII